MRGGQLVFGRIAREATGWDSKKMERIARLLNPAKAERRALEKGFPKTLRILESLALAEMEVGGFEEGVSDSLRMRAKAELGPGFGELGRSLKEETAGARKAERRSKFVEGACKFGALCAVGFPASSLFVISFFNIRPTDVELAALGIATVAGAAMGYAAHRLGKMNAARRDFEETVGMLAAHVRDFLEGRARKFADDE